MYVCVYMCVCAYMLVCVCAYVLVCVHVCVCARDQECKLRPLAQVLHAESRTRKKNESQSISII